MRSTRGPAAAVCCIAVCFALILLGSLMCPAQAENAGLYRIAVKVTDLSADSATYATCNNSEGYIVVRTRTQSGATGNMWYAIVPAKSWDKIENSSLWYYSGTIGVTAGIDSHSYDYLSMTNGFPAEIRLVETMSPGATDYIKNNNKTYTSKLKFDLYVTADDVNWHLIQSWTEITGFGGRWSDSKTVDSSHFPRVSNIGAISGEGTVRIPKSGEADNTYAYSTAVLDQYGGRWYQDNAGVTYSLVNAPGGISISSGGTLTVTAAALNANTQGGDFQITIRATDGTHTSQKTVTVELPRYNVTYCNHNGTVLQGPDPVRYNTTVSHTLEDPSKAPDAAGHYVFAGWSSSTGSTVITGDTTFTATYTVQAHRWKYSENFTRRTCRDCGYSESGNWPEERFADLTADQAEWEDGYVYRAAGNITIGQRVNVTGNVTLDLAEGATLTCACGISVFPNNSLTIGGSGTLIADASHYEQAAGIGGSERDGNHHSGAILINGGTVTANGGTYSAGIGGSHYGSGNVTINGGTVTAQGGRYGSGIGGGRYADGGSVTINGGTVTATAGLRGAGIGGGGNDWWEGNYGNGGTITINGGKVTATGSETGAGIGGGGGDTSEPVMGGHGGTVIIRGGNVTAVSTNGADIGPGLLGNPESITLGWTSEEDDCISAGTITANVYTLLGDFHYWRSGTDRGPVTTGNLPGKNAAYVLRPYVEPPMPVDLTAWEDGKTYTASENVTIPDRVVVSGTVTMTIEDGVTVTCEKGITVGAGSSLTVTGGGTLIADAGEYANGAGIGGDNAGAGTVIIDGCTVTATGGAGSAGIGGGNGGGGGNITIIGGRVTAESDGGSAIGPGAGGTAGRIALGWTSGQDFVRAASITASEYVLSSVFHYTADGTDCGEATAQNLAGKDPEYLLQPYAEEVITSESTEWGNGIVNMPDGDVTIAGRVTVYGTVTLNLREGRTLTCSQGITVAEGNTLIIRGDGALTANAFGSACGGAGIGAASGNAGKIIIDGGIITATAGPDGAGIGGGLNGNGGTVVINGGTVEAMGGNYAAGIGGGAYGAGESITIRGGTVSTSSQYNRSSMGGGTGKPGGEITISGGQVHVTGLMGGGIGCREGTIRLTWTTGNESIYASDYYGNVYFEDGREFVLEGTDETARYGFMERVTIVPDTARNHPIAISGNGYGAVTADAAEARYGQTVTLTVLPEEGGSLVSLTVKTGNTEIQTTAVNDTTRTFVMPAGNVAVYGRFSPVPRDLVITGEGDHSYGDGVLTITEPGNYTISMRDGVTSTTDQILVNANATSTITLDNVHIDTTAVDKIAMRVNADGCTVRLAGTNTLTAEYRYAFYVDYLKTITITSAAGDGSLEGSLSICSSSNNGLPYDVTIKGGTIYAEGYYAARERLTITGGDVTLYSHSSYAVEKGNFTLDYPEGQLVSVFTGYNEDYKTEVQGSPFTGTNEVTISQKRLYVFPAQPSELRFSDAAWEHLICVTYKDDSYLNETVLYTLDGETDPAVALATLPYEGYYTFEFDYPMTMTPQGKVKPRNYGGFWGNGRFECTYRMSRYGSILGADLNGTTVVVTYTDMDGRTVLRTEEWLSNYPRELWEPEERPGLRFLGWMDWDGLVSGAISLDANTTLVGIWVEAYVTPDFVLPDSIDRIEESAFEDASMTVAYIPDGCTYIGPYAFRNCYGLERIRIPADCEIGEDAFDECFGVLVFGTAGSPAEEYCETHDNCFFVEE